MILQTSGFTAFCFCFPSLSDNAVRWTSYCISEFGFSGRKWHPPLRRPLWTLMFHTVFWIPWFDFWLNYSLTDY
jgi:hypothetical protein